MEDLTYFGADMSQELRKLGTNLMQGATDPLKNSSALSVPVQAAPGLKGPVGITPKQTGSKVVTTSPEPTSLGLNQQNTPASPTKIGEAKMTAMAPRPTLQDMMKAAAAGIPIRTSRAKLAEEAARQIESSTPEVEKKASDTNSDTTYARKLASAGRYALELLKQATPGEGGGALPVSQAVSPAPISTDLGHSVVAPERKGAPPMEEQNKLKTNENELPGGGGTQHTSEPGSKGDLRKVGQDRIRSILLKTAAPGEHMGDESISTSPAPATQPGVMDATDPGPPGKDKDKVPATATEVANFKPRDGKATPKREAGTMLDEPMQSSRTDPVLQHAFTHTEESGAKISSVVKNAAGRALLSKLAEAAKGKG